MSKSFAGKSELHNYKKQYNCESTSNDERMCTFTYYVIWVCFSSYLFNEHCEQITFMLYHAVCKCNIFMCYPPCTYMYLPITHLPSYITSTYIPTLLYQPTHFTPTLLLHTYLPILHLPFHLTSTLPLYTYLHTLHLPSHLTTTLLPCQGMFNQPQHCC